MPSTPIDLTTPVFHVDVVPGGTITLRGAFHSTHDGSVVDAATTTWPSAAPGGSSVDSDGLFDLEGGGFHVVSRNPDTHEVVAVATSGPAEACEAYHVPSPCLVLRTIHQAQRRMMTTAEWTQTLQGGMQLEVQAVPVYAPVASFADKAKPYLMVAGVLLLVGIGAVLAGRAWRRHTRSPRSQMLRLAATLRKKVLRADPILAGPLAPALEGALRAIHQRKVDPESAEGKRVFEVLRRVEAHLDEKVARDKADHEREAADDLVRQVEVALEAAGEAAQIGRARTR